MKLFFLYSFEIKVDISYKTDKKFTPKPWDQLP